MNKDNLIIRELDEARECLNKAGHAANGGKNTERYRIETTHALKHLIQAIRINTGPWWERMTLKELGVVAGLVSLPTAYASHNEGLWEFVARFFSIFA